MDSLPREKPAAAQTGQRSPLAAGLLASDLDVDALALEFKATGRLQIHDALRPQVADALHQCLAEQVPWALAFRDHKGARKLWAEELAALDSAARQALETEIQDIARETFQFRYDSYMMVTAFKERRDPGLLLHEVVRQINSPPWLQTMRRITGCADIRRTDAQATRFVAGNFLKLHDDRKEDEGRLVAYVINLTRDWQADWGGLLHFTSPEGDVVESFLPYFNSISLLRVPQLHFVSQVASYARGARYAITGWLRQ